MPHCSGQPTRCAACPPLNARSRKTWRETRVVAPNAVTLAGWDYKQLVATGAQATAATDKGELPRLEIHDASRPYRFEDGAAARLRTDLAVAALESGTRRYFKRGTVMPALGSDYGDTYWQWSPDQ